MHLLAPLAAGVTAGANGTAQLFKRGSSTRATWYRDFEGTQAVADGADLALDATGGTIAYVNELVNVIVKDANGNTVRVFVAGEASGAVEYQGQSFTGTDYTTGASAAGKPTTLQAILDLWKTNSGSIDWKVLVNGTATKLSAAIGGVTGLFFNVKDPAYGAVGDGVTNDTSAITAALTAANVSGGTVFFPPGSYRVTSALTLGASTSLLGAGPTASAIGIDHASANLFNVSGSSSYQQSVNGLRLLALQSNTGTLLSIGSATNLHVRDCTIGDSNSNGDVITATSSSSTYLLFQGCDITVGGTTKALFNGAGALARGRFIGCNLSSPTGTYNATNGMVFGRQLDLISCRFVNNATGGTYSCFKTNSTTLDAKVIGCDFGSNAGGTVTAIELGTYTSTATFYESNNVFGSNTAYSYTMTDASKGAIVHLVSRDSRAITYTSDAANLTIAVSQYGTIIIKRSANSAQTCAVDANPPDGSRGNIVVWNNSGGSFTAGETFSAPFSMGAFPSSLSNNFTSEEPYITRIASTTRLVGTANVNTTNGWSAAII